MLNLRIVNFLLSSSHYLTSSLRFTVQQIPGKLQKDENPHQEEEAQSSELLSESSVLCDNQVTETPQVPQPIAEEQAKRFMDVVNSRNQNQLSFVISGSMYQDPQQIKDSLKSMWNKNFERLHFLFRVEYLNANSGAYSLVSDKGQDWGYLSLSSDSTSLVHGSFARGISSFFRPVIEAVAQLRGVKMTSNPPQPSVIPFQDYLKEEDSKGISNIE